MKNVIKKSLITITAVVMMFGNIFVMREMVYAASGDTTVYLTKTGECYHLDGCRSLKRSKIATTLQNAVDRGYRPCSLCNPGTLDATTTSTGTEKATATTTTTTTTTKTDPAVEALKTYSENTKEFNAYVYYMNNADLQTAIGADGDKLLKHYNEYGKKEGRKAI